MSLLSDEDIKIINSSTKFKMQYPEFRYSTMLDILENILLPEVKAGMVSLYYSKKIIDATTVNIISVDSSGDIEYEIISDYSTDKGFDVSTAREEGTRRHFIKPVHKLALSWLAGYIRLFSKGHWVRGITKSNVIQKTITRMEPQIQQILDDRTDQYWNEISGEAWQ